MIVFVFLFIVGLTFCLFFLLLFFVRFLWFVFFPRLKLALGVLTSVEQLVPPGRPPGFPEVPRGSSGLGFLADLDVWTFRRMDV